MGVPAISDGLARRATSLFDHGVPAQREGYDVLVSQSVGSAIRPAINATAISWMRFSLNVRPICGIKDHGNSTFKRAVLVESAVRKASLLRNLHCPPAQKNRATYYDLSRFGLRLLTLHLPNSYGAPAIANGGSANIRLSFVAQ